MSDYSTCEILPTSVCTMMHDPEAADAAHGAEEEEEEEDELSRALEAVHELLHGDAVNATDASVLKERARGDSRK
jgi:hypothetical protein